MNKYELTRRQHCQWDTLEFKVTTIYIFETKNWRSKLSVSKALSSIIISTVVTVVEPWFSL